MTAALSIKRPISNIDIETQLFYDITRHDKNVRVSIHYGKEKDIVVTLYWYHPRFNLERIEGSLNVTIPTFSPMLLEGKLIEKNTDDFTVSFHLNYLFALFVAFSLFIHVAYLFGNQYTERLISENDFDPRLFEGQQFSGIRIKYATNVSLL